MSSEVRDEFRRRSPALSRGRWNRKAAGVVCFLHPPAPSSHTTPHTMTSVVSRAIFIQTYPGLKSLSESKLLLEHLQRFGRVATFRNLRVRLPIQTHSFQSSPAASSANTEPMYTYSTTQHTKRMTQNQYPKTSTTEQHAPSSPSSSLRAPPKKPSGLLPTTSRSRVPRAESQASVCGIISTIIMPMPTRTPPRARNQKTKTSNRNPQMSRIRCIPGPRPT